ncbi:MAG: hypothetical protein V1798_04320 [Pseudomonadota bacterium]
MASKPLSRWRPTLPSMGQIRLSEIFWAVLPGVLAGFAILYPFFLSSGEFIYLDWSGTSVNLNPFTDFMQLYGQDWLGFRFIPFLLAQLPFILLFGAGASAIFSKLFFLFIFALASTGLYLLLKEYSRPVYLLAVALLCFSPFVYERVMMGQFFAVLSLAALPLILHLAREFVAPPSFSSAWKPAAALTFLCLQAQGLLINTLVVSAYLSVHAILSGKTRELVRPYLGFAAFLLLFNLYWLIPGLLFPGPPILSSIDSTHLEFFQPRPSANFNTLVKAAGMYGAWRENSMRLAYNYPLLPVPRDSWKLLSVAFVAFLLFLSAYAILHSKNNAVFITLLLCWPAGLFLAAGISHPWSEGAFGWFAQNLPFFSAFRDSNKWVELVAIAYAVLAPIGASILFKGSRLGPALAVIFLLVLVYDYPIFGLSGQISPGRFPGEYATMGDLAAPSGKTIYLPWMLYASYNWSSSFGPDGRIAVPLKFSQPAIISGSDAADFGAVSAESQEISDCLALRDPACLASRGVSRVIVDECFAARDLYSWVGADRHIYKRQGCLTVYELKR